MSGPNSTTPFMAAAAPATMPSTSATTRTMDWYMFDAMGVPVLILQTVALILLFRALLSAFNLARDLLKEVEGVCEAMERIPSLTANTLWYPKNVAVIASVYRISPAEVDSEYRKEEDAKRWIVNNTFEENDLTKKLLAAPSNTRFMSVGYDYRPQRNLASMAGGLRPVASASSAAGLKSGKAKA